MRNPTKRERLNMTRSGYHASWVAAAYASHRATQHSRGRRLDMLYPAVKVGAADLPAGANDDNSISPAVNPTSFELRQAEQRTTSISMRSTRAQDRKLLKLLSCPDDRLYSADKNIGPLQRPRRAEVNQQAVGQCMRKRGSNMAQTYATIFAVGRRHWHGETCPRGNRFGIVLVLGRWLPSHLYNTH